MLRINQVPHGGGAARDERVAAVWLWCGAAAAAAAPPTPEEEPAPTPEPDEDDVDLDEILRELDGEDDEEMISLRQLYGKKCPEKFFNADREAITMAIVYSISSILIKEKTHQVTIIKTVIPTNNRLSIENILLNV